MTLDEARSILEHPAQHGGLQSPEVAEAIGLMIAAGEVSEQPAACVPVAPTASEGQAEAQNTPKPRYRAVGNLEVGKSEVTP